MGERYSDKSPKKQIAFAASVSMLNPHAVLDTIGVIGTSSLTYTGNEKWMFTFACILVSCVWFIGLSVAGRTVGKIDHSGKWMIGVNIFSAFVIWGAALYIGWQLLGIF